MKLKIFDLNQGQVPSTIEQAIQLSHFSRKEVERQVSQFPGATCRVKNGAYHFAIVEKGFESLYKKEGK